MNQPGGAGSRAHSGNLKAVLLAGILYAAAFGIYETSLPLYLNHLGISFMSMGIIFGASQIGILAFRWLMGVMSDRHGRKPFFVGSLGLIVASTAVVPVSASPAFQAVIKIIRDAAAVVRDIMRSLAIYESAGPKFVRWIGRAIGTEFIFMAAGAWIAGVIISRLGYARTFHASAVICVFAFLVTWRFFHEGAAPGVVRKNEADTGPDAGRGGPGPLLPPNLWVMAIGMFIFNIGLMTSHSFYLLLFFQEKFALPVTALSLIQAMHRLSLGIPTILAAQVMDRPVVARHYKGLYIASIAVQGTFISLAALFAAPGTAVAVFVLHDFVGASLFSPIQATFLQRFARPDRRGRDVSLASGIAQLGAIFGPVLAGWLVDSFAWRDGPYIMSGVIIAASSLVLLGLRDEPLPLANERSKAVAYPNGNVPGNVGN